MFSGVRWRISVYLTKTYQNTYQIAYIQLILCLLTIFYKITIVPHTDTNSRPTDYKSEGIILTISPTYIHILILSHIYWFIYSLSYLDIPLNFLNVVTQWLLLFADAILRGIL